MRFFGHQMLTLWKFALLGKRILFFSPPPIGDVCYRGEFLYSPFIKLCYVSEAFYLCWLLRFFYGDVTVKVSDLFIHLILYYAIRQQKNIKTAST